ncbi:MAG: protein kinase [Candidatus Wallbacteria bacterium]|nr:protein kinase [Candidatus Wallbacteria bacterium]
MPGQNQTTSRPALGRPCPDCGERALPGVAFCGKCGHRFPDLASTHVSGRRQVPEPGNGGDSVQGDTGPIGPLPTVLGSYRVDSVIGSGGMGWVYKAVDVSLARTVALKTLSPELAGTTEARQRFEREARTVAALEHPNITAIYFLDAHAAVPYYTMEFVQGESLDDRMKREGRLAPLDVCRLMAQAAGALAAAAAAGVVHRDIKPSNILLRSKDGAVKLTDFGLAKPVSDKSLTGAQAIVGTPLYMSPEQAMGKPLDFRSDLYSLGVTFYHALAGQPPYDDDSAMAVMLKHLKDPLPPLGPLAPGAPATLVRTLEKMLEKEPARRHATYDALVSEVATAGGELSRTAARTSGRVPVMASQSVKPVAAAPSPAPSPSPPVPPPVPAARAAVRAAARGAAVVAEAAGKVSGRRPAASASGSLASAQTPAPPASTAASPDRFPKRVVGVLVHPLAFFGGPALTSPAPLRHWLLVMVVAALESGRPAGIFIAGTALSALVGIVAWSLLLVLGGGASPRRAARIVAFSSTPLLLGSVHLFPLNFLYMLALTLIGVAKARGAPPSL